MDRAELERVMTAALRQLPGPTAPATLLPRVLAAVGRCAQRPWYSRAWLTWPVAWQTISATAVAAVIAAAAVFLPAARATVGDAVSVRAGGVIGDVATAMQPVSTAARLAESTASAVRVVWRVVFAPVALYAAGLVMLMCLTCVAFGTALTHITAGKALPR